MRMLLARWIHYGFSIYEFGLLVYVLCGWVAHPAARRLRLWLSRWYEPMLEPIRSFIPMPRIAHAAVDFSPIILFIVLSLFKNAVLSLLMPPF